MALNVKNQLIEMRKKNKFTQQQIADIIGVVRSTYTYYETGKTTPSITILKQLAQVYNIPVDDFIKDDSEPAESYNAPSKAVRISQNNILAQLSEEERTAVAYLRLLNSNDRAEILEMMKQFTREHAHTQDIGSDQ